LNSQFLESLYKASGVVFANRFGEIYLEGSGFDPATKGFTIHRPFVKYVVGRPINGITIDDNINMVVKGVPGSGAENMPLFIKDTNGGYVYNNVDLYTSGNIDYASGDMTMVVSGDRHYSSGDMNLFTSGVLGVDNSSLNLRVRGK
jgi:hypothetical protein